MLKFNLTHLLYYSRSPYVTKSKTVHKKQNGLNNNVNQGNVVTQLIFNLFLQVSLT